MAARSRVGTGEPRTKDVPWLRKAPVAQSATVEGATIPAEGHSNAVNDATDCRAPRSCALLVWVLSAVRFQEVLPGAKAAAWESILVALENGAGKGAVLVRRECGRPVSA